MPTCFLTPLSVSPNGSASSPMVAGPRARRWRMLRRVGSERAKNVRSKVPLCCTDRCTIARRLEHMSSQRRLILYMSQSLDGFAARRDGTMDWLGRSQPYGAQRQRAVEELLGRAGLLVLGGRAAQEMAQAWPSSQSPTGEYMNALPKVVFSSTLTEVDWSNARVSDRPVEEEVAELKRE